MEGCVSILSLLQGFSGERPTPLAGGDTLTPPPPPYICAQALIVLKVGEELRLPELWGGFVRKPQAALLIPGRQLYLDPMHSGVGQTWGEADRAEGHRRAEWQDHPSLASTPFSRSLQHN